MVTYDDIVNIDKIISIYNGIRKTTCHKSKLIHFELSFSSNVTYIYNLLKEHRYKHGHYNIFLISDPKYRIIMSECITDKIINHLLSTYLLVPTLENGLIEQNVATRIDKGNKAGLFYMKKYLNSIKINYNDIYVLKCDISKYFYNINHEILKQKLKKDILDADLYDLLVNIIDSTNYKSVNKQINSLVNKEIKMVNSLNIDDKEYKINQLNMLPRYNEGSGLPIGNETSQILAIYYLSGLDHFIKEKLKIKYYIRYMDDFVLIHHDREYLKYCLI